RLRKPVRDIAGVAVAHRACRRLYRIHPADLSHHRLRHAHFCSHPADHDHDATGLCKSRRTVDHLRLLGFDIARADDVRSGRDLARPGDPSHLREVNFASDNTAPVAPAILDAIVRASAGYALGYGNDDWTAAVERRLAEIFEHDVAVFLVATGTAANALALAQVTPPWGVVLCHAQSHIVTDECGAPEFFG